VYALGCVLFEILAGQPLHPRGEGGMRSVLEGIDARPSVRVPGRDTPPELDALCVAATAMNRERRIQTARELGERVQRFLDGDRDLALREELAHEHLDQARAAFARGDGEAERAQAMREAGRALALDPKLDGAADLISRLMLEPPRETPPAVQRLIEAGNLETLKKVSRAAALGYLGFLAFLPVLVAGGREQLGYAAALAAVILVNVAFLKVPVDGRDLRARAIRVALGNAALIALLARMSSPFLFAPGVAALATMALVFSPTYTRLRSVALLAVTIALAVLVPWLLEWSGAVSATTSVTRHYITLDPVILEMPSPAKVALLVLYVCAIVTAAAGMAFANRRAEREVRYKLHLQAWQLSQLVPQGRALTV
jgi:serine/threonine-protein kinase